MKNLRFGILGLSDGNGHPYSWSAICNGYDPEYMKDCGFPVIPEYLAQQEWPESALPNVNVTHVWTQDPDVSARIADASKIQNVVTSRHDMIGDVDAVLLARDDAVSHFDLARPFLEAGLPVYIDKPIALTSSDLERLSQAQVFQDQIFTGFWHHLCIRRLPGRSHRLLPGFYPSYLRDFKVLEGKTYQKPTVTHIGKSENKILL